jgi:hypothetical protein
MKALEKERDRRYQTALGLADDIRRHLSQEAVLACPPSPGYRFRKFARRNRALLIWVGTIFLVLLAGLGATSWSLIQAVKAERRANESMQMRLWGNYLLQQETDVKNYLADMLLRFDELACNAFDEITSDIGATAGFHNPEVDGIRRQVFGVTLQFWDGVIASDVDRSGKRPNARQRYHRLQRALCLARSGAHVEAFAEVNSVKLDHTFNTLWFDELFFICALCASSAHSDVSLASRYAEVGIEHLRRAAELAREQPPPEDHPELTALRMHPEFAAILESWRGNYTRQHD